MMSLAMARRSYINDTEAALSLCVCVCVNARARSSNFAFFVLRGEIQEGGERGNYERSSRREEEASSYSERASINRKNRAGMPRRKNKCRRQAAFWSPLLALLSFRMDAIIPDT